MILVNGAVIEHEHYWDHVEKFGLTPDMDSIDTNEEVWDGTGAYTFPTTATAMTVSSSSTDDDGDPVGTGCLTFTVIGLDANYEQVSQTVTMNGQAGVSLPTPLLRVYRAYVNTAGTGTTNAGDIWVGSGAIGSGVPANKFAGVLAGNGQTLMAIYTIPAIANGKTLGGAQIHRFYASSGAVTSARSTVALQTRQFGQGWRSRRVHAIGAGAPLNEQLEGGIYVPAKSDIRVRVLNNGVNNTVITAGFDLHLY